MINEIIVEPELLWALYWGEDYTIKEMSNILECGTSTIARLLERNYIPRRLSSNDINIIVCDWCNKKFPRRPSDVKGTHNFCSKTCRLEWHSKEMTEKHSFRWKDGKKLCVGCGNYLLPSEFYSSNVKKSGLTSLCKECGRKRQRGKVREVTDIKKYKTYKYEAKIKKLDFDIPIGEFTTLIYSDCYYCGGFPNDFNGIDRVDNSKGYISGNYVPCCKRCNYIKRAMSEEELSSFIMSVYPWAKKYQEEKLF